MNNKVWYIYKHTNKVNSKSYIGITSQSVERRWQNGYGYNTKDQLFARAIHKYGWENFEHTILEECNSLTEANQREQYWITYYHTYIGDPHCNGYNMTLGGDGTAGHYCSEEAKEKIRIKATGRLHSTETKQKISSAITGNKNPFYGRHHSPETIEKIKRARAGYTHSEETKQKISETQKGKMVSDETRQLLSKVLKGKKRSEESRRRIQEANRRNAAKLTPEERAARNKKLSESSTSRRKVMCIETGEIFESLKEAAEKYGFSPATLCNCLAGRCKTVKRLHWKEVED